MRVNERVRQRGITSLAELLGLGYELAWIKIAEMYGGILRVRKGWYVDPGEVSEVIQAWRVGGRLTCVSALALHGECAPPPLLHVEVPGNTARLRSPTDHRRRLGADDGVIVHWNRNPSGGDRRVVDLALARKVAAACREGAAAPQNVHAASECASKISYL